MNIFIFSFNYKWLVELLIYWNWFVWLRSNYVFLFFKYALAYMACMIFACLWITLSNHLSLIFISYNNTWKHVPALIVWIYYAGYLTLAYVVRHWPRSHVICWGVTTCGNKNALMGIGIWIFIQITNAFMGIGDIIGGLKLIILIIEQAFRFIN